MRIFLDTNVLVSAFATRGLCADVLRIVLAEHELVLSEQVLSELRRTLGKKLRLPAALIDDILSLIDDAEIAATAAAHMAPAALRDPSDAEILRAAIGAKVDALVTGDEDLLSLGASARVRVMSPRALWKHLGEASK